MNNILSLIKKNVYATISIFAISVLLLSNAFLIVKAQESEIKPETATEQEKNEQSSISPEQLIELNPQGSSASYPHLNCIQDLVRTTEPSDQYISNAPYSLQFHSSSLTNNFQDINGDNLPDYVYAYNNVDGGNTLVQTYMGCVYLNNGAGWDKAYQCYAITQTNVSTGQITLAEYYGDCAGEPTTKS